MKLSVIIPVHNQHALADAAIRWAKKNLSGKEEVEFILLDNASTPPFFPSEVTIAAGAVKTVGIRLANNIGVYPTFWEGLKHATGDVLAYLHSDVFIDEEGWDTRVLAAFEADPKLGLVGFVGSNEIDAGGGRGAGTTSNFLGHTYHSDGTWIGSPAEVHGARNTDLTPAAVVDGCVMIFRRETLEQIPERTSFPPHHFYDRLLSCEVRENGWKVAVLGVGFDHISGQTVNQESSYGAMAQAWAEAHGLSLGEYHNWDTVLYREAERQWFEEYRDTKHLIPVKV